jgi:hypothetical protein
MPQGSLLETLKAQKEAERRSAAHTSGQEADSDSRERKKTSYYNVKSDPGSYIYSNTLAPFQGRN